MKSIITCKDFNLVLKQIKIYIKDEKILVDIVKAYEYAKIKHEGQLRRNNDPYLYHVLSTAYNLALWNLDPATIQAGFLHDILEDTPTTYEQLVADFSQEIADLVQAVTKVSHFAKEKRNEIKADYLRKLYLSLADDVRVIIIKLADRLHNIRTIEFLPYQKQIIIAQETLEVYGSIAHRLGMREVQRELEDRSFAILYSKEHQRIINLINLDRKRREHLVESVINEIKVLLSFHQDLKFEIYGRSKGLYSIYRKMYHFGKNFDDITDLLAIRLVCSSIDDCYAILGYIHQKFMPLNNRFKDYIATPKNNLYRSLHTSVVYQNEIYEIQIRTSEMEDIAESGAAAHWRYKEGEAKNNKKRQQEIDEKLGLFQTIIDLNNYNADLTDDLNLAQQIKQDLFSELIYVLTPNAKVITLPLGACVLDFAYKIHTEVGEKTTGARINGVFSPINSILKSGDVVEIKTSKLAKPSYDWLTIVKTNFARNKIKKYLQKQTIELQEQQKTRQELVTDKKIEFIKEKITKYIHDHHLKWRIVSNQELNARLKFLKYQSYDELCLKIASEELTIENAISDIFFADAGQFEQLKIKKPGTKTKPENDILVEQTNSIKTSVASCCLAVPGDKIVGYITKGFGIKVHRAECPNVSKEERKERLISTKWHWNSLNINYQSIIKISYFDRPGLLADVTSILNQLKIPIDSIDVNNKVAINKGFITIYLKIRSLDLLQQVVLSMKKIPDVSDVIRVIK